MNDMKNIILGVTASVAAIKTVSLAEALSRFSNVRIVITEKAEYFIKSDYEHLKQLGIPIFNDEDEWPALAAAYTVGEPILHIEMRRWADCFLIAPLDANTLAKITYGLCDNLLTSIVRAWDWSKPMVLCPAMNTFMWVNPPTSDQINQIKELGALFIDPVEKKLACNDIGMGAMASVEVIAKTIENHFAGLT